MQLGLNKNTLFLSIGFFLLFLGFLFLLNPSNVFAQPCVWRKVIPEKYVICRRVGNPQPTSCNGVNASFCTGLIGYNGIVTCQEQFDTAYIDYVLRNSCTGEETAPNYPNNCTDTTLLSTGYVACQNLGSACGDWVKQADECCDEGPGGDGSTCNSQCFCINSGGFCGDGTCNGYETDATCSNDCNPPDESPNPSCASFTPILNYNGASVISVYQGDTTSVYFTLDEDDESNKDYDVTISGVGCPANASCPAAYNRHLDDDDPPMWLSANISNTANTPAGNYSYSIKISNPSNSTCSISLPFSIAVKPSRKTVCDDAWYPIPPSPFPYSINSGPNIVLFSGNIKTALNSTYYYTLSPWPMSTTGFLQTMCRYLGGAGDTCTWDLPTKLPSGSSIDGWPVGTSAGAATTLTDSGNRTYEVRRVSSGPNQWSEYRCNLAQATADINANPLSIPYNTPSTLSWTSSRATSCSVSCNPTGNCSWTGASNPSQSTGNLTASKTYTLSCQPSGPNSTDSVTVTVAAASATADISANPTTIPYNTPATITWSSTNATSCSVSPTSWSGTSGNQSTGNLTTSRTYSLSCQPSGPNSTDAVTVNVQAAVTYGLTVIKSGQGTVTSSPAGINCGPGCQSQTISFTENANVTLTATPASGRIFTGWSGACSGTGGCSVLMNGAKSVTANFAVNPAFKEF